MGQAAPPLTTFRGQSHFAVWLDEAPSIGAASIEFLMRDRAIERRRSEVEREIAIDAAVIEHMRVTQ